MPTGGKGKKAHAKKTSDAIREKREQGLPWGRRSTSPEKIEAAKALLREGVTLGEVCKRVKVSTATLYKNGVHAIELKREGMRQRADAALSGQNVLPFSKAASE